MQRSNLHGGLGALWLLGLGVGLVACQPQPRPNVAFGSAPAVGTWQQSGAGNGVPSAGTGGFVATAGSGVAGDGLPVAGSGVPSAGVGGGIAGSGAGGVGGSAGFGGSAGTAGSGAAGTGGTGGSGGAGGSGGSGGSAGTGGTGGSGGGTSTLTSMTYSVLTHSQGGTYSPKNIGAIWIENSSGAFVKTLAVWAGQRIGHLTKYNSETFGNKVDAVTSATLPNHVTHSVSWNMKDVNGNFAPDGDYKVIVECTDRNAPAGAFNVATFTKGSSPQTINVPDATYYTGMQITLK